MKHALLLHAADPKYWGASWSRIFRTEKQEAKYYKRVLSKLIGGYCVTYYNFLINGELVPQTHPIVNVITDIAFLRKNVDGGSGFIMAGYPLSPEESQKIINHIIYEKKIILSKLTTKHRIISIIDVKNEIPAIQNSQNVTQNSQSEFTNETYKDRRYRPLKEEKINNIIALLNEKRIPFTRNITRNTNFEFKINDKNVAIYVTKLAKIGLYGFGNHSNNALFENNVGYFRFKKFARVTNCFEDLKYVFDDFIKSL